MVYLCQISEFDKPILFIATLEGERRKEELLKEFMTFYFNSCLLITKQVRVSDLKAELKRKGLVPLRGHQAAEFVGSKMIVRGPTGDNWSVYSHGGHRFLKDEDSVEPGVMLICVDKYC